MSIKPNLSTENNENYPGLIRRLLYFHRISQNILEKKPLATLLNEIINSSKLLLDAEASSLLLYNPEDKKLYFHTVAGEKKKELKHKKVEVGEGLAGWVAQHQKVLNIDDCYSDNRFNKEFDKKTGFKTRNMICAPMIRKNELVGVIQVINKKKDADFNQLDEDLFSVLASECALAIENARLTEMEVKSEQIRYELGIAREIQQKLLPHELPVFSDLDLSAKLIPAKEVGGDYYNIIKITEDKTLLFVADVSGKSIPAALIVSTIYSFIQTFFIINKGAFELKSFVESLNSFLISATTADKFATAWFGVFNHDDKTLLSINAGHNPIFLLKKDKSGITELNVGGLLLGGMDLPYETQLTSIAKSDTLVLYTDGIPEAMNTQDIEYGEERFGELVLLNKNLSSDKLLDLLLEDVQKFCDGAEQSDDITCCIVKIL